MAEPAPTAATATVLVAVERAIMAAPDGPAEPETVPAEVGPKPLQNGNDD